MWSAVIVKMLLLVEGGLLNTGFAVSCDGSLHNTHPLIIQKSIYVFFGVLINEVPFLLLELQKFDYSWAPSLLWERFALCVCVCVCVCVWFLPTGRSFHTVLNLRCAFWPLNKGRDPLLYPAFPLKFFQVASLPSIANGTRSPWNRVWPSQTLCPL